jgi:hypothetical protein
VLIIPSIFDVPLLSPEYRRARELIEAYTPQIIQEQLMRQTNNNVSLAVQEILDQGARAQ